MLPFYAALVPSETDLVVPAALIGEPARAAMLLALMDGRSRPAGELARLAGIRPPTASGHLQRLTDGGLIRVAVVGRNRYYRLAGSDVARQSRPKTSKRRPSTSKSASGRGDAPVSHSVGAQR